MLLLWIIGDIFTWCSCRTIQGKVNWLGNSIRWKIWFLFTNRIRPLPWIRENRFLLNTNRKAWQYSLVSKKKALRKEMDLSRLIRWEALWTESRVPLQAQRWWQRKERGRFGFSHNLFKAVGAAHIPAFEKVKKSFQSLYRNKCCSKSQSRMTQMNNTHASVNVAFRWLFYFKSRLIYNLNWMINRVLKFRLHCEQSETESSLTVYEASRNGNFSTWRLFYLR